jgi:ABC-type glycerol-3-phosphate transport system substrate-binding protein
MRVLPVLTITASLALAACGGSDETTSSPTPQATTTATTGPAGTAASAKKIDAACTAEFKVAVAANADFVPEEAVKSIDAIADVAASAGEQSFAAAMSDYGAKLMKVGLEEPANNAADRAALDRATETATAQASDIGAPECAKIVGAFREAAGTG